MLSTTSTTCASSSGLPAVAELGRFRGVHPAAMLDERLAHLERKIQTGKMRVAFLEFIDAAEAEEVVVEAAVME